MRQANGESYSSVMGRELKLFGGWGEAQATVWSVTPSTSARRSIIITYSVNRKPYSSELRTNLPFAAGQIFSLRYDPANPKRNELRVRQQARQAVMWGGLLAGLALAFGLSYLPFAN
jgi:hypothetical protein